MGSYADVVRIAEDRVLKVPKIYPENNPELAYSNYINRTELQNEGAVYKRLGTHDGIIRCFEVLDESIELAFANQGDLDKYIRTNPPPSPEMRAQWIRPLVEAISYVHSCRVVLQDIALRNILIHNYSPKLCDFGDSSLLPLDTNMQHFCESGTTPQIEILYVGCVLYSIAAWKKFKYDYFENERFPEPEELPVTDGVLFERVIRNCWAGQYTSMEAVGNDVHDIGELETTPGMPNCPVPFGGRIKTDSDFCTPQRHHPAETKPDLSSLRKTTLPNSRLRFTTRPYPTRNLLSPSNRSRKS
jgi:serine/threonine protein kinase